MAATLEELAALGEMEQKPADVVCSPPLKERRRRG
jgi:hypothetical protein